MNDFDIYRDIAPYTGEDVTNAVQGLLKNFAYIESFISSLVPHDDEQAEMKKKYIANVFKSKLEKVTSYDDFQRTITAPILLKSILDRSSDGLTVSGTENLKKGDAYLFISNHRDIVLDCSFCDYALNDSGLGLCEMAIGDNLLANKFIEDLLRLNGGIIIKRELPLREKYTESIRVSQYMVAKVLGGQSIWIAQKSGRSKDGIDLTHSSIIKMLGLSQKRLGVEFSSLIKSLKIVPIAISYEKDPNDINKARELYSIEVNGKYNKKPLEDSIAMLKGLRQDKGRIHIAFGKPLVDKEYNDANEVAKDIDLQIHNDYKLFPSAWFAYDYLNNNDANKDKYQDLDTDAFLSRYSHLREEVKKIALAIYANPVKSFLKEI